MNVLLITYYAPPLNAITSQRAFSLAQLLKTSHSVHLITRSWTGNENTWEDMLEDTSEASVAIQDGITIHYRPYRSSIEKRTSLHQKYKTFGGWLKGDFNPEIDTLQFKEYALQLIQDEHIQVVYATCPPLNIIKLGSELSQEMNLPFLADFRDLKNEIILNPNARISKKEALEMKLLKRFLKNALVRPNVYVSTVNEPFRSFISEIGAKECQIVLNGFEEAILEIDEAPPSDLFRLSLIGTLYPKQELEVLLKGLKSFLEAHPRGAIEVLFIGTGAIKEVANHIEKTLSDERVFITPKIRREEALRQGSSSHVLFYSGWTGYKGVYSGKMFEYLGLRRRILLAPGDGDVLDELLLNTNSGTSVRTWEECSDVLNNWFDIWRTNGQLPCESSDIQTYSREHQNSKIARIIDKLS